MRQQRLGTGCQRHTLHCDAVGIQAVHQHIVGVQVPVQVPPGVKGHHSTGHLPQNGRHVQGADERGVRLQWEATAHKMMWACSLLDCDGRHTCQPRNQAPLHACTCTKSHFPRWGSKGSMGLHNITSVRNKGPTPPFHPPTHPCVNRSRSSPGTALPSRKAGWLGHRRE